MVRKKKRPRPIPEIEIIETLQPAPTDLDFGTKERPKLWYLVWTTPRGEERAAEGLLEAGCQVFWPHCIRTTKRKNKPEVTNKVSTFPRYLFVSGLPSLARRLTIVGPDGKTGITVDGRPVTDIRDFEGVVSVVRNSQGWCPVPRGVIQAVALTHNSHPEPVSSAKAQRRNPEPGNRVVILDGPFMHFQATVMEVLGPEHGVILIDMFGGQVRAEIGLASIAAA